MLIYCDARRTVLRYGLPIQGRSRLSERRSQFRTETNLCILYITSYALHAGDRFEQAPLRKFRRCPHQWKFKNARACAERQLHLDSTASRFEDDRLQNEVARSLSGHTLVYKYSVRNSLVG